MLMYKNKLKPPISTQSLPFHLTQAVLTSWGYKFNENEIDLSSLNIGSIEANLFSRFACLQKLTLRRNKMLRLYQDTFKNCVCLTYLDMSYNRLSQVQQGDFDGAVNLESIYLNNNLIEHISLNTFFNLPKIVNFNIGNNPISVLYNFTLSNGVLSSTVIG
jgi:Leucine-rich repeat (LRR) protein